MSHVDYSRAAADYDRHRGALIPADLARQLAEAAGLRPMSPVLDIGAGTGRVALALAALGCRVAAADPSFKMLEKLRSKSAGMPIGLVGALGASLPFRDRSFEAVVLARILYLMADWRAALGEVARLLRPDGYLLHEWSNGSGDEDWVQIREKARSLFEEAGIVNPFHPGARQESEVDQALAGLGFTVTEEIRAEPDRQITLATFLSSIASGECSYVWSVPADVQARCLPELSRWASERFDLDQSFPQEVVWKVYRATS